MDYNQNDPTEESDDEEEATSTEVQYYEAKKVLKKTPESPVWKFFVFPGSKDSINEKKVACKLCLESSDVKMRRKVYSYSGGTKNLIDHLERCHKDHADWKTAKEEDDKKKKAQNAPNKITAYTNALSTVPKWPKGSSNWKKNTQLLSDWWLKIQGRLKVLKIRVLSEFLNPFVHSLSLPVHKPSQTILRGVTRQKKKR